MDISVIVPLYRGMKYLDGIQDMLEENLRILCRDKSAEVIFVNDYPQDEYPALPNRGRSIGVKYLSNECNLGIHRSRIKGVEASEGEYVLFLDQDDQICDTYLKTQLECIGDADAVLCNGWYRNGRKIYSDLQSQNKAIENYIAELNSIVSPGQVIVKRDSIPEEWEKTILLQNGSDDVLLWIIMICKKMRFAINPSCQYVHGEDGNNTSLDFGNMVNSMEELSSIISNAYFIDSLEKRIITEGLSKRISKQREYQNLIDNWDGIINSIKSTYNKRGFASVMIYGFGVIGQKLVSAIEGEINIKYIVDARASSFKTKGHPVCTLKEVQENVDWVIITPVFAKEEIKKALGHNIHINKITALDELLLADMEQ